jgi:CheY-like chemotaxis protein
MNDKSYILVADDEETSQLLVKEILSEYEVKSVSNGRSCVEMIKERKPELLILDIQMPDMNGFDVILELHNNSKFKDLPIIFYTITPKEELQDLHEEMRANDILFKPFQPKTLLRLVKKYIH